jgi:hypothetical protein
MPLLVAGHYQAYSFAAVGFHLCNNEHPAAALTVDSLVIRMDQPFL